MLPSYLIRQILPHFVICLAVYVGCATMPAYKRPDFSAKQSWQMTPAERAKEDAEAKRNEEMNRVILMGALYRWIPIAVLTLVCMILTESITGGWRFRNGDGPMFMFLLFCWYLFWAYGFMAATCASPPLNCWLWFVGLTTLPFGFVAFMREGYPAFCQRLEAHRHSRPKQAVKSYYQENVDVLEPSLPPALFQAKLEAAMPEHDDTRSAYQTAGTLIGAMHPVVTERRQEQEREREAQVEAQREIDKQKKALLRQIEEQQAKLQVLRNATVGEPDLRQRDIANRERRIEQLQEQIAELDAQAKKGGKR
jgi:hypothetical protein